MVRPYSRARSMLLGGVAPLALLAFAVPSAAADFVTQTNIISDGAVSAPVIDSTLKNPWGITFDPGGAFWISEAGSGNSPVYTASGALQFNVVVPAPADSQLPSIPTGQVFNPTQAFPVSANGQTGAATFLIANIDGAISGWNGNVDQPNFQTVIDNSAKGAVYTGIAVFSNKQGAFLLAANFGSGLIEVYDGAYNLVGMFRDHALSGSLAAYNVQVLNQKIYVTYAVKGSDGLEVKAPGNGVVEMVDIYGTIAAKANPAKLNAPWGMTIAPPSWGNFGNALLVGNFGDGRIHVYDPETLASIGTVMARGNTPFSVDGLWGLMRGGGGSTGAKGKVFFAAGINNTADGLFGSLSFNGTGAADPPSPPPPPPSSPPPPPPSSPPPPPPPYGY